MNRFLTALILHSIVSAHGAIDPFSNEEIELSEPSRFEILESRVLSRRVITFEEIECLPEDATAAEIFGVFGTEAAEAPEIPFFFVYPREGQPRSTSKEKYRYGFYFWPLWKGEDFKKAQIICISYFPKEPNGEMLSEEWIASHEIIWPESKKGTKINIEDFPLLQTHKTTE